MSSPLKILLVAYYFPPVGGAGAQRPLKFAKYLAQLGWSVTVLTKKEAEQNQRFEPADDGLSKELAELERTVEVVRIAQTERTGGGIDPFETWSIAAGSAAAKLVEQRQIDISLITMSPFSLVRVAAAIRATTNTPVVLDLRDPWALDVWQKQKSYWHWKYQFNQMRSALMAADLVIMNTEGARRAMLNAVPDLSPEKATVVTNGYDADDFDIPVSTKPVSARAPKFKILFTGSLLTETYQRDLSWHGRLKNLIKFTPEKADLSGRTLIHLLAAFRLLQNKKHEIDWEITCIGAYTAADVQSVKDAGYEERVKFESYLRHDKLVKKYANATCLFLPLHNIPDDKETLIVPGKTYEYLASGRPILGCLPTGDAKAIVDRTNNSATCNPTAPIEIAEAILKLAKKEESGKLETNMPEWITIYERQAITRRLDKILRKTLGHFST